MPAIAGHKPGLIINLVLFEDQISQFRRAIQYPEIVLEIGELEGLIRRIAYLEEPIEPSQVTIRAAATELGR